MRSLGSDDIARPDHFDEVRVQRNVSDTVNPFMSECGWMIRIPVASCLAVSLLLSAAASAAGIEKWVDSDGNVHYGDHAPAGAVAAPLDIRPNVIESDPLVPPADAGRRPAEPAGSAVAPSATSPQQRRDVQAYIEQCRNNRGVDCEHEAEQMLEGPAPVIFPGDPAVFPRPDIKPPPPGLPLKYQITP